MTNINNDKIGTSKSISKKVYVQPSIQGIGSISKQTKTNNNANSRDNTGSGGGVIEKGS